MHDNFQNNSTQDWSFRQYNPNRWRRFGTLMNRKEFKTVKMCNSCNFGNTEKTVRKGATIVTKCCTLLNSLLPYSRFVYNHFELYYLHWDRQEACICVSLQSFMTTVWKSLMSCITCLCVFFKYLTRTFLIGILCKYHSRRAENQFFATKGNRAGFPYKGNVCSNVENL